MADQRTGGIAWTDFSINPIRARLGDHIGHYCEKVSPGCKNCYSSRFQPRFGLPQFQEQRANGVVPFFDASKLAEVLRRRTPAKFFWCDMTDMFGEWIPNEWIAACFGVMAATPQHVHQVLTKRAKRMRQWFDWVQSEPELGCSALDICMISAEEALYDDDAHHLNGGVEWPLPNVWLGTSVEDQQRANERITPLLDTPAAVRFVSYEPALGPVNFHPWLCEYGSVERPEQKYCNICDPRGAISWVIVGGESGPNARPFDIAWARSTIAQCKEAGVACFVKQLGTKPVVDGDRGIQSLADYDKLAATTSRKFDDPSEWPEDLRVREFPR